jgi:hypothetical protein
MIYDPKKLNRYDQHYKTTPIELCISPQYRSSLWTISGYKLPLRALIYVSITISIVIQSAKALFRKLQKLYMVEDIQCLLVAL